MIKYPDLWHVDLTLELDRVQKVHLRQRLIINTSVLLKGNEAEVSYHSRHAHPDKMAESDSKLEPGSKEQLTCFWEGKCLNPIIPDKQ